MEDRWPESWTRAALEICVLSLVRDHGPTHGYDVAQRLRESGFGAIKGGTLYPVLSRLQERGLVESHWTEGVSGPGRKVFRITEAGSERLGITLTDWSEWNRRVSAIIGIGA